MERAGEPMGPRIRLAVENLPRGCQRCFRRAPRAAIGQLRAELLVTRSLLHFVTDLLTEGDAAANIDLRLSQLAHLQPAAGDISQRDCYVSLVVLAFVDLQLSLVER